MVETPTSECQLLFLAYLSAEDPVSAQGILERLLSNYIEPISRSLLKKRLNVSAEPSDTTSVNQDMLEIVRDVQLSMMTSLRRFKVGDNEAVRSLEAYTTSVTRNAYNDYCRAKFPNRFRLRNQLRYVFTKTAGLELHSDPDLGWICGRSDNMTGSRGFARASLNGDGPNFERDFELQGHDAATIELHVLVESLMAEIGGPAAFDEIVSLVAELRGVTDDPVIELDERIKVTSDTTDHYDEHDRVSFLAAVWKEMLAKPLRHRRALLLHLADDQNDNLLIMFTIAGVVSVRKIAEALEMPAGELAKMWDRLPLPDREIGVLMGLTSQQVINLRQSARRALRNRFPKCDWR